MNFADAIQRNRDVQPEFAGIREDAFHRFPDHVGLQRVGGDVDELGLVVIQEAMADLVDVLAKERLAARDIQPDQLAHGLGNLLNMVGLQRFALIQVLPVEAGAALGVAMIRDEKDQMDGLLLALGELFPGQNIGG